MNQSTIPPSHAEIDAPLDAPGIYVKRDAGVVTLDVFALGRTLRYTLPTDQASALGERLMAATDCDAYFRIERIAVSNMPDPAHSQVQGG